MGDDIQFEKFYKEKIELENALKQRNFEIDLFWKRSWFFGALVIAEIAAYYKVKTDNLENFPPVVIVFITCLTIMAQCLMNRGSKYWQERWEYMTMNREAALNIELTRLKKFEDESLQQWLKTHFQENDRNEWFFIDACIASKGDNFLTKSRRFSVSKITFLVWDIIFICSLLCWLNESVIIFSLTPNWFFTAKLGLFYTFVLSYILGFLKKGNVHEKYEKSIAKMEKERLNHFVEMYLRNEVKAPLNTNTNE